VADGRFTVYRKLVGAQARSQASYRVSFALDLTGNIVWLGVDVLSISVLFRVTRSLGGFTFAEVLVMLGLSASAFAMSDLAVGNIERLRFYVRTGLLDAVLVRPLGVLPQLLAVDFGTRRIGRAVYAVVLLVAAVWYAGVAWTPAKAVLVVIAPLAGAVFFSSIFVAGATVAFWWIESGELANSLTYGGRDVASYPMTIYNGWFRRLFAYAIGFAFIAYYPALALLGRPDPLGLPSVVAWAGPAVATLAAAAAAGLWRFGVRHYRSTGS
jgi:ABC-2 type transport system permease protein